MGVVMTSSKILKWSNEAENRYGYELRYVECKNNSYKLN